MYYSLIYFFKNLQFEKALSEIYGDNSLAINEFKQQKLSEYDNFADK